MERTLNEMKFLTLFISLRCTNECEHCVYACGPDRGEDMSLEIFEKSIHIAKDNNIKKINFFGGEPFFNFQIFNMLDYTLKNNFDLVLATNGYFLNNDSLFDTFHEVTHRYKERIMLCIGYDKYHKKYFDSTFIANKLKNYGYHVKLEDYCEDELIISDLNKDRLNVNAINSSSICCCSNGKHHSVGILPNGAWSICPPSLLEFGNIENIDLQDLLVFKQKLPFQYEKGCSLCLKDFDSYHKNFMDSMKIG
ncbi:4Fe-4S cluster-binding domain-containing protein [Dehalobacter sp. DCM]|uniref:radical SAM protein n=1 Tax=Dehalobacter sp. DCM TaxID=2907827 RepID=UPI003081FEC0|nr:4Fe-4S cluster-binding domain-containing protein [Dehalobacter sp. DCM]